MPSVARLGDHSNHGGTIVSASSTVFANGKKVARVGDMHVCPLAGHGTRPITTTLALKEYNGVLIATIGSVAACGAVINEGSPNVFINGGTNPTVPVYTPGSGEGELPPPYSTEDTYSSFGVRVISGQQAYDSGIYGPSGIGPANAVDGLVLFSGGSSNASSITQGGYALFPFYYQNAFLGWGYAAEGRLELRDLATTSLLAVSEAGDWNFSYTADTGWSSFSVGFYVTDFGSYVPFPPGFDPGADPNA